MAEISLLQTHNDRAKNKARVCMTGHVIKCVTSMNTSNSTKTQNVDMSYQTFFFFPESSAHKKRLARETNVYVPGSPLLHARQRARDPGYEAS